MNNDYDIAVKNADGVTIYYKYINNGTELEVTSNNNTKYSGVVVIPEEVTYMGTTRKVTRIGSYAFCLCQGLTHVTIPNSVTHIYGAAFDGCSGLTSIIIPNSVKNIWPCAFQSCSGLTSLSIPNSAIDDCAFAGCSGLTTIIIGKGVNYIGDQAFSGCSSLTTVISEIEDPIEIDTHVFDGIHSDANLIVPQGTKAKYQTTEEWNKFTNIVEVDGKCGDNAYYSYDSTTHTLTISGKGEIYHYFSLPSCEVDHVIIESGIYYIGEHFLEDSPASSITIPSSLTSIDDDSFWFGTVYITDLEAWFNINFHHNTGKANRLFLNGEEIKDLVIPNTVKYISGEGSVTWSGLTSVTIPNSVTSISSEAFQNCYNLTSIKVEDGNPYYDSRNNCNAIIDSNNQLIVGCKNTVIPNSVTSIGHCAFRGCTGLTSITIPNNVTSIGHYAFSNCSGLTSVNIPDKVTSIGDNAFFNCYSLVYISLSSKLTSIGEEAFRYCRNLIDIYCKATNVPNVAPSGFSNSGNITLHVPSESLNNYKSTEPWKNFESIVSLDNSDTQGGQKCSTPTISFSDGVIFFSSETPDVRYRWVISPLCGTNGTAYYNYSKINTQPVTLSVFATKSGYQNSDVATYVFPSLVGDVNQDGVVDVADHVKLSEIIMNQKQ